MNVLTIYDSQTPGFYAFKWVCHEHFHDIKDALQQYPGCNYAGIDYGKGMYLIAAESVAYIENLAQRFGLKVYDKRTDSYEIYFHGRAETEDAEHEFKLLVEDRGALVPLICPEVDQKIVTTVLTSPITAPSLLVCKAANRAKWVKLTGGVSLESKQDVENALETLDTFHGTLVISFSLLKHLSAPESTDIFGTIMVPDAEKIRSERSATHKQLVAIRIMNPDAMMYVQVPKPLVIEDLCGYVGAIWPGRFGKWWDFVHRYMHVTKGEYNKLVLIDAKEELLQELSDRCAGVSLKIAKKPLDGSEPSDIVVGKELVGDDAMPDAEFFERMRAIAEKGHVT